MNKINLFKISIFSIIALTVLSLSVFATNQAFADTNSGSASNYGNISRDDFMTWAESNYNFMQKSGRMPANMTKDDYLKIQEDMYKLYDEYGMGPGMMSGYGGGVNCPMLGDWNNSGSEASNNNVGSNYRNFGGMMGGSGWR